MYHRRRPHREYKLVDARDILRRKLIYYIEEFDAMYRETLKSNAAKTTELRILLFLCSNFLKYNILFRSMSIPVILIALDNSMLLYLFIIL